ncbi:MAG: OsmC family protein [Candidatus Bipolaricaulota bacterium]|nr:OsmC family protein [Candidatus Bipolaricaulota bacterium]MDW8127319.1 OsmC family protein [Candidatus Bipolaricaulota bacterium]
MAKLLVKAQAKQGFQVELGIRQHRILADLTPDKGGKDGGPTPPELLLASLAACSAIFARMFAQREGLPGPVEVQAEAELVDSPMVVRDFRVRVRIAGLPPEKREKAEAFVGRCVVSQTLCAANAVSLTLEAG